MVISIALEALNQFMVLYKQTTGESITQKQALFLAGFNVHRHCETKMQVFRSEKEPSKIKEGLVIHGYLRNMVKSVDSEGKLVYSDKPHFLHKLYEQSSVVTGKAVLSNLINVIEYGDYDPNKTR